jgi:hypothetical protein
MAQPGCPSAPTTPLVMAGLLPAIHAFHVAAEAKVWLASTRPAMTVGGEPSVSLYGGRITSL